MDGLCLQLQADFCSRIGGTYVGGFCLDAGCPEPEPVGACCVGSGCAQIPRSMCDQLGGTWIEDGSCDDCPSSCPGDVNGDGVVDGADLGTLIGAWGLCP